MARTQPTTRAVPQLESGSRPSSRWSKTWGRIWRVTDNSHQLHTSKQSLTFTCFEVVLFWHSSFTYRALRVDMNTTATVFRDMPTIHSSVIESQCILDAAALRYLQCAQFIISLFSVARMITRNFSALDWGPMTRINGFPIGDDHHQQRRSASQNDMIH